MSDSRYHNIDANKSTRLRVGIKWDPLERDKIGEAYALEHAKYVRMRLSQASRRAKAEGFFARLFRLTFPFQKKNTNADKFSRFERAKAQNLNKISAYEKYLEQADISSFDLDLCCYGYSSEGKLIKTVSPTSAETPESLQNEMAFMHSGDDNTGTGDLFDEELLVNPSAIPDEIYQIFFVILSVNHSFNEIKGGFWTIVNTNGENALLSSELKTESKHALYVMAKMFRDGEDWILQQVSDYCWLSDDALIPVDERVDRSLTLYYLTKEQKDTQE